MAPNTTTDIGFRLVAGLIYFIQFFAIIYCNSKSRVEHAVYDRRESKLMVAVRVPWAIAILASLALYLAAPDSLRWGELHLPPLFRLFGVMLGVVTDLLLFWTLASLGANISTTLSMGEYHRLVRQGPYRYVRHPMYGLGVILFISLMLISSNWIIGALGIGFQAFVMITRTPSEEAMLRERFGHEYDRYRSETGRFVPKIW